MSLRTFLVIVLALACGISAAIGIQQFRPEGETKVVKEETVNVVVAAVNMQRGARITDSMIYTRPWPKSEAPPEAIEKPEEAIGRMVHIPMLTGDVVVLKKISKEGEGSGLPALIKPGLRAFTIFTPPTEIKSGFLLPGHHVDVLLTLKSRQGYGRQDNLDGTTVVLVSDVEIIASGKDLAPPIGKERIEDLLSVTLQVTEEQALSLSMARTEGTLSLALRNSSDHAVATSKVFKRIDFLRRHGLAPPEMKQPQGEPVKQQEVPLLAAEEFTGTIEILRGSQRDRYVVKAFGP
jgi:pilus assembly protein CpaB